jgi:hypothetical protein
MWRFVLVLVTGCSYQPGRSQPNDTSDGPGIGQDANVGEDSNSSDATTSGAPFLLSGADWLLPCSMNGNPNPTACRCTSDSRTRVVGGQAGERWHVTVRIRGVMEKMGYLGGTAAGGSSGWYVGGTPGDNGNNFYKLTTSSPLAHYFINAGVPNQNHSWPFDYEATFDLDAGATVTFDSNGQDTIQWEGVDQNDQPISIAGITDPAQPYNGQFAQLDVLGAVAF